MADIKSRIRKRKNKKPATRYNSKMTIAHLLKAMDNSYGNIKVIAERMGKPYPTVYNFIRKAPEDIQELLQMEREKMYDVAESTVIEMSMQRFHFPTALSSSKFLLTNGPNSDERGYKDKKELTIQGGARPIQVENAHVISLEKLKTIDIVTRRKMLEEMSNAEVVDE